VVRVRGKPKKRPKKARAKKMRQLCTTTNVADEDHETEGGAFCFNATTTVAVFFKDTVDSPELPQVSGTGGQRYCDTDTGVPVPQVPELALAQSPEGSGGAALRRARRSDGATSLPVGIVGQQPLRKEKSAAEAPSSQRPQLAVRAALIPERAGDSTNSKKRASARLQCEFTDESDGGTTRHGCSVAS